MPSPTEALATLPKLLDVLAAAPADVVQGDSGMIYGHETKYLTWDFNPAQYDHLEFSQITDAQFGHIRCKVDRLKEYRDWILAEPFRFMLWTGDMVDAWAMWSPGQPWEQIGDPQSQVFKFCELFAPARHRVLGFVGGNHERRAIPGFGDLGRLIATLLKLPYSAGQQWIDINFGKHSPYTINLWHGRGNPRTLGAVAQMLDRQMKETAADTCLIGHVHRPLDTVMWKQVRDRAHRRIVLKKCYGAIGSSFLEFFASYGEVAGFSGHDVVMPRIVLTPDGKSELTLK